MGDIVISSVLASSYTKSAENAQLLHKAGKLFRDISKYIDTEFAAYLVNFWYNYVFKPLRAISIGKVTEYYLFVPIVSSLSCGFLYSLFCMNFMLTSYLSLYESYGCILNVIFNSSLF